MKSNLFLICICVIFLALPTRSQEQESVVKSVLFIDLDAERNLPTADNIFNDLIKNADADIAIFAGLKGKESLEKILKNHPSYKFSFLAELGEPEHLAMISKKTPIECNMIQPEYKIKNDTNNQEDTVKVLRGFIVAKFAEQDYEFTLIAAHLKSRDKHPFYNQFDMRRYEARQLRYIFDEIIKKKEDANVLVIGNMNDSCGMSPIKEIYARRYGNKKRLFDIRPVDELRTSWTKWIEDRDVYERTSYAMASYYMLPEIERNKTHLIKPEKWLQLSRHRALLISFVCTEREEFSDAYLSAIYPNSIYSEVAAHFEKDKLIGEKPKRKSPESKTKK